MCSLLFVWNVKTSYAYRLQVYIKDQTMKIYLLTDLDETDGGAIILATIKRIRSSKIR